MISINKISPSVYFTAKYTNKAQTKQNTTTQYDRFESNRKNTQPLDKKEFMRVRAMQKAFKRRCIALATAATLATGAATVGVAEYEIKHNSPVQMVDIQTSAPIEETQETITPIIEEESQEESTQTYHSSYDYDINLSSTQEWELNYFLEKYNEQKDTYQQVEDATGVPKELVAAIFYRENGQMDMDYSIKNGSNYVGKENWADDAINCINTYCENTKKQLDKYNLDTYCELAESWNGKGYEGYSPYIWEGTTLDDGQGRYTADGVYDPNATSNRLGVMVILNSLLGDNQVD